MLDISSALSILQIPPEERDSFDIKRLAELTNEIKFFKDITEEK